MAAESKADFHLANERFRWVSAYLERDKEQVRQVYEAALQRRGVRTIILDEAQHLLKLSSGVKMIDQLDWLKSMTNTTGVLHILTGTYELLPLRNLNGQAARRVLEIHFPRYQFQHEPDQLAFQRVLLTLLQQMPLEVDVKAFIDQWPYFYERCIGCMGVLKDWLVRALAATIGASQTKLLFERIQECALPIAQCESNALLRSASCWGHQITRGKTSGNLVTPNRASTRNAERF